MLKNILLPVDLDHEALWTKALPVACSLAERDNASLHVLTIVPDFGMSAVSQYFPENYREETMERELAKLNAFVKEQVPDSIASRSILGERTIYEAILNVPEKIEADLIVLAPQRPELKNFHLGPNAARVVRHAECSVYIVRG